MPDSVVADQSIPDARWLYGQDCLFWPSRHPTATPRGRTSQDQPNDSDQHAVVCRSNGQAFFRDLWAVAVGALAYSTLRFFEAYGLWRERAWAEWLALISGAIYLPFEIFELARRPDWVRLLIFLVNLAVVLYMAFLRWQARTGMESSYGAAD